MERLSPQDSNLVNVDTSSTAWSPGLTLLTMGARDEEEDNDEVEEEEDEEEDEEEEHEKKEEGEEGAEKFCEVSRSVWGWKTQRKQHLRRR